MKKTTGTFKRSFALLLVALLLFGLMPPLALYASDRRDELVGEWEGTYYNNFGVNGLNLSVFVDGADYRAVFSFFPVEGSPAGQRAGSFYSNVRFNNQTNVFEIIGSSWIEMPSGWAFVDLFGTISGNIFSGEVRGLGFWGNDISLGTFSVTRVGAGETDSDYIRVYLNGKRIKFDQQPIIEDGRTLVPIRAIAEAMGATVGWEDATGTAIISFDESDFRITRDINSAQVITRDGTTTQYRNISLDVPMRIINDRTFVPLRFLAQAFGARVDWDGDNRIVNIWMAFDGGVVIPAEGGIWIRDYRSLEPETIAMTMRYSIYMPYGMAEAIRAIIADELGTGFMHDEVIIPVVDYLAMALNIPQVGAAITLLSFGNMIGDTIDLLSLDNALRRYKPNGFIVMTVFASNVSPSISFGVHNNLILNDLGERGRFIPMSSLTEEDRENILAARMPF